VEESEPLRLRLGDDDREAIIFHRWFAIRGASAARAAVAFTTSPDWLNDPDKLALMAGGDDAAIASAIAQGRASRQPNKADGSHSGRQEGRMLDLCAGVGTVGAMAVRLGFDALSVEVSIVPHLIDRVLYDFAVSLAESSPRGADNDRTNPWRGFVTEVEAFANAVWRGAKQRLKELLEEDVDVRLWLRLARCPNCGRRVPVLANARLSGDIALNLTSDSALVSEGEYPRFDLLRTEFPDRKGTFSRGICTCPACHFHFRFRGYDLIPLPAVPVAVRMKNSSEFIGLDSPGAYVTEVDAAARRSLAASSRMLNNRLILADEQSIFHDARGEPISVHYALLPRQRAYFAALAESMHRESETLAHRAALTDKHRFAVRSAVALLISGQIDYVNTFNHSLADRPHPSTFAGPLRVAGLFTEVGGSWLNRSWQNRLRYLLGLLRDNSSLARPVQVIQAEAAAVPIGDSAVSAVVWDPPYYDNIDYDVAGEPYQAILAAVVPDLTGELVVAPKLPLRGRIERYEQDLRQQASEARRVVTPNGGIGVFWLAKKPEELQRFLEMIAPAGLQLLRAVRLDPIRVPRVVGADPGTSTYLLILQPIPVMASAVVVDAGKVLALATIGALSLYDGLAELLESVWDPAELQEMISGDFRGSSRQRLAGFLASHPQPEQLLVELGRVTLIRELAKRGAKADELRTIDIKGLAHRLLAQLGFAAPQPVRFSIRSALHECEVIQGRLQLADSMEAVRGAFLTGCSLIERILRYASLAWAYLVCGNQWNEAFSQIISPGMAGRSYSGPDKLTFGQHELLFTKIPVTFADKEHGSESALFAGIARVAKKAKAHEKLSALVALRNSVEHDKESTSPLSSPQLRKKCTAVFAAAYAALADVDSQQSLPLTVSPEEERRDRYGRRVLRLLDSDGVAIEAYVGSETDLTEPLIYFASDSSRRDVDPKLLRAAIVEEFLGIA
jgi:hypothetical protein